MPLKQIYQYLPARLTHEITAESEIRKRPPEEIRIHSGRRASLTYGSQNLMLESVISDEELRGILRSICKNSVYAYKENISQGYIPLEGGVRVGVAGSAFCEGGSVSTIYDITSVIIRIPRKVEIASQGLCDILKSREFKCSCLIYASSGEGKTTVLRSAAYILSGGNSPLRVSVIDTREELGAFLGGIGLCIDILKGYPKDAGCEIATRTLNSQLIICDEIFGEREAAALLGAVNCGIPLLCSAHASSITELLLRPGIDTLHKNKVFDLYVKIKRGCKDFTFEYETMTREEADACLLSLN